VVAEYAFAGDEHGFLMMQPGSRRPALGEAVELIPAHCDTTVNLHAAIHAVRGIQVEGVWPIGARGVW
jgi:D-serine deaminase-like pyridoxal phosphate-dependent protein